mgnify:FL=1|jgi:hypothetical protein
MVRLERSASDLSKSHHHHPHDHANQSSSSEALTAAADGGHHQHAAPDVVVPAAVDSDDDDEDDADEESEPSACHHRAACGTNADEAAPACSDRTPAAIRPETRPALLVSPAGPLLEPLAVGSTSLLVMDADT